MLVRRAISLLRRGLGLRALGFVGTALLAAGLGCGGAPPQRKAATRPQPVVKTPAPAPAPPGPAMLPAHVLAELSGEDVVPMFARRGGEGLLLHASGGMWKTRRVGSDGAPKGDAVPAGPAPAEAPAGVLRPLSDGYLAAWVETIERNHAVKALVLDAEGKPRGPATLIMQSAEDVAWVDVLPNATGAVVLWEAPRDDRFDVLMSVYAGGKLGSPVVVARDLLGWQAIPTERGAAIAIVRAPAQAAKGGAGGKAAKKGKAEEPEDTDAKLGSVGLVEIDATGKVGAPIDVSGRATAQIDVEIALVDGRYVLAWTDERDIDASVYVAVVEPGGKLAAEPRRATPPAGEQALVSLVAAPYAPAGGERSRRALLAWEDLIRTPQETRLIHLATVGPDATLGKERAALIFGASGPPDLAADGEGFAAVTLAPASAAARGGAQEGQRDPIWPTYVRFGPDLSVRAAEPVRAAPFAATEGVPYLVRGLSCHAGTCTTLASAAEPAAGGAKPGGAAGAKVPLALVSLPVRESAWRAPAYREDDDAPPRATAVAALYDGDHLAEVAATSLDGGRGLAAWVTYYLEGSSDRAKRGQELGATVGVRAVGGQGGPGKVTLLSQRAWSLGGVAIAAAPVASAAEGAGGKGAPKQESVLAWVAREKGETQVYVTKLDQAGEKLAQKKLTVIPRKARDGVPNEASDVAVAHDGSDGWIVAWVDTRDGNAEVYVARVDATLRKTLPDRRITEVEGDAAEVQIAVRGKETWLVWSDARQSGAPGRAPSPADEASGDVFLARLDTKTLQKIGAETRLFASAEHSRSPSIAPFGGGMVVGWIEEPPGESASAGGTLRIAQLDERGALLGAPVAARATADRGRGAPAGAEAPVSSVALACDKACRGVLTSSVADTPVLAAFTFTPGRAVGPVKTLASLTGSSAQDVSPVLAGPSGSWLFFADDAVGGSGRVRWMTIAWP